MWLEIHAEKQQVAGNRAYSTGLTRTMDKAIILRQLVFESDVIEDYEHQPGQIFH